MPYIIVSAPFVFFVLYALVALRLSILARRAGGVRGGDGRTIKVFSINPMDNVRYVIFLFGSSYYDDALRNTVFFARALLITIWSTPIWAPLIAISYSNFVFKR
jgi:hypothetical protein